jgi:hypothetical protein
MCRSFGIECFSQRLIFVGNGFEKYLGDIVSMNMMQDFLPEIWKCDFLAVCNILEYSHGGIFPRVDNRPVRS